MASYTVHQAPVAAHTVTAAYAPAAATVAVARPAPVAVAAAATAAAYGGYPTAHTATDYGYTQRQQEAPPPPPPATTQNYQVRELLVSRAFAYRPSVLSAWCPVPARASQPWIFQNVPVMTEK